MVLRLTEGGAGRCRAPRWADEAGAQSLEFALTIPFVVLAVVLVLHAGVFGTDLVAANALALQAARVASIDDDAAVRRAVEQASGARPVEVVVDPPDGRRVAGDAVSATVRLRSRAFAAFGAAVWAPAKVTLRVEGP